MSEATHKHHSDQRDNHSGKHDGCSRTSNRTHRGTHGHHHRRHNHHSHHHHHNHSGQTGDGKEEDGADHSSSQGSDLEAEDVLSVDEKPSQVQCAGFLYRAGHDTNMGSSVLSMLTSHFGGQPWAKRWFVLQNMQLGWCNEGIAGPKAKADTLMALQKKIVLTEVTERTIDGVDYFCWKIDGSPCHKQVLNVGTKDRESARQWREQLQAAIDSNEA